MKRLLIAGDERKHPGSKRPGSNAAAAASRPAAAKQNTFAVLITKTASRATRLICGLLSAIRRITRGHGVNDASLRLATRVNWRRSPRKLLQRHPLRQPPDGSNLNHNVLTVLKYRVITERAATVINPQRNLPSISS